MRERTGNHRTRSESLYFGYNLLLVTVAYEENNAASMNLHFFYVTKEFKIERLSQQDLKSMKFTSVIPSPNGYNFLLVAEDSALLIS